MGNISVAYIHHATCLPASSLQPTIVCPRYELPYHCQLMIKLSHGHGVMQWCFFMPLYFLSQALWCEKGVYLFSDKSETVHFKMAFCGWCVVEAKVMQLLALPNPCCCAISFLGCGPYSYSVNLPQHRPRNVRLCCCLSPSIILGHCQREREMGSTSYWWNERLDGISSRLVGGCKNKPKRSLIIFKMKS